MKKVENNAEKIAIAERIVARIVDDILDRSGLGDEWDGIDDDVRDDIRDAWVETILKELP